MSDDEPTLRMGFTSPTWRPLARGEQPRKRNVIGFVHFWEPEEDERSDAEYHEILMEWEEEDWAEEKTLRTGFTAAEP